MESEKKIAHEIGGVKNDALRFGLHGVKSNIIGSHPLESSYESEKKSKEALKRTVIAHAYGTALPLKMDMDRQILSRFQRPPGPIPSSMLGLEVYTGAVDDFGFEDYLNDPRDSETFKPVDFHHGMEVRLGISKGPIYPSFICGRATTITKAWTNENPGRRFVRCGVHGFINWADAEKPFGWQKQSLLEARDEIRQLSECIKALREQKVSVSVSGSNDHLKKYEEENNKLEEEKKKLVEEKKKLEEEKKKLDEEKKTLAIEVMGANEREKMLRQLIVLSWGCFIVVIGMCLGMGKK